MWELTRIVVLGIGATLATDAWGFVARRLLGMQTLDYRLVGRWIESFPRGRFFHRNILEAQPTPNEKWLGWTAHFAIGIAFAWLFVALVDRDWLADPRPEVALVFGLATVAVPFLVMQPAFGFGVAAARTPDPLSARMRGLLTHAIFGLGLYLSAELLVALEA